jgi:hypothetical protein
MVGSKKGLLTVGVALAAGGLAAVAFAQEGGPHVTVMVTVEPNEAGTPSRPRGIEIDVRGTVVPAGAIVPTETGIPAEAAMPVVRSFDVWLPKGWVYNGAKLPACALAKLSAGGPAACPPESIMGRGQVNHPNDSNDISSSARVIFINGGAMKMYFWVVMQNPARAQVAVPGTLTKVNSPRWSYRLHADNPSSLQIVSGIPTTLNSFSASFGRGDWIATTSCPRDHRWRYRLRMTSTSGQVLNTDGSVSCRS